MMSRDFTPAVGADGWSLSTSPIMLMAPLKVSLEIFKEAGMNNLAEKRKKLTKYLEEMISCLAKKYEEEISIRIITPKNDEERGAQLSMVISKNGKEIFNKLSEQGVLGDWREPEVIRLSPAPLYNSFEEVYKFGEIFDSVLQKQTERFNKENIYEMTCFG